MKTVIITGVAGMIGANLAEWVLKNKPNYKVIGIDNLFGGYREYIPDGVEFHQLDLAKDDLDELFDTHRPQYVFHFAAYAAEGLSPFIRRFNYENNVLSTVNIINNCINFGVERLVYTSSMSVYGNSDGERLFDERDQPHPMDPYAISKYACEMDIQVAGEQHGLDWCIIRPHNVYGKYQNIWDRYRNVLGIWMNRIKLREPMLIYGDGEQVRAFSYIEDYLTPLWNAATRKEASKEIINVGGIHGYTLIESAKTLIEVVGKGEIRYAEPRFEAKHCVPTWQKSVDILGFRHTTDLRDGLKKMWNWAKSEPDRDQFVWDSYEITQGIYSYWSIPTIN